MKPHEDTDTLLLAYAVAGASGCDDLLRQALRAVESGDWRTVAAAYDQAAQWLIQAATEIRRRSLTRQS